jgi:aryl-alcohol dehydrogenase-like predicted oxidoreductase
MRRIPLGSTEVTITDYCLGTMTWGNQTPEADAHCQMDMALDAGIDIVDTAEMYPVNPVRAETVGGTERIVGTWNAKNPGRRGDYKLATKISGKNGAFVRPGQDITGATFAEALDASLARLQTDHIDIYQLHWPNRGSYHFRQNWTYDPSGQDKAATLAHMHEVLEAAEAARKAGKIGHVALSNESAWGTAQWLRIAEETGLPRVQSIQNEYSLLCRLYDTDLAELAVNEKVTLLAFSPAGRRFVDRQIPGWRGAQGQPSGKRPRTWRARDRPRFRRRRRLSRHRGPPRTRSRSHGAGVHGPEAFSRLHDLRGDHVRATGPDIGRARRDVVAGSSGGDRRHEPGDAAPLLIAIRRSGDNMWIDRDFYIIRHIFGGFSSFISRK